MKSPAQIIAKILQESGVGSDVKGEDWFVYVSSLPHGEGVPLRALAVTDTIGRTDGRVMTTGEVIEHPGIQIRVRGLDYDETHAKIREAQSVMDGLLNRVVAFPGGETRIVHAASRSSTLGVMGWDETGQAYHLSINYTVTVNN